MTARAICQSALRLAGLLAETEPMPAEMLRSTFEVLGEVTEELAINRQLIYRVERGVFNLSNGVKAYAIGDGATFDVPRPVWIEAVGVIPDSTLAAASRIEKPLGPPLSDAQYAAIALKDQPGPFPTRVYYDHQYAPTLAVGLGNVIVWPVPDRANVQLALYLPTPVPAYENYDTDYTFPPGYKRVIRYKTSVEMCGFYEVPVPSRVERTLVRAEADLKRANFRPQVARFDSALVGPRRRGYDIYSDGGR